jgi:DoxX-like family
MKTNKIIYWISTALLCLMMFGSAGMYIFNHQEVAGIFTKLGFPTYIVYPLAVAKILGVLAILSKQSKLLKEWAYAGFFFDFLLAISAHINAGDGEYPLAVTALVLLLVSYFFDKKVFD